MYIILPFFIFNISSSSPPPFSLLCFHFTFIQCFYLLLPLLYYPIYFPNFILPHLLLLLYPFLFPIFSVHARDVKDMRHHLSFSFFTAHAHHGHAQYPFPHFLVYSPCLSMGAPLPCTGEAKCAPVTSRICSPLLKDESGAV